MDSHAAALGADQLTTTAERHFPVVVAFQTVKLAIIVLHVLILTPQLARKIK